MYPYNVFLLLLLLGIMNEKTNSRSGNHDNVGNISKGRNRLALPVCWYCSSISLLSFFFYLFYLHYKLWLNHSHWSCHFTKVINISLMHSLSIRIFQTILWLFRGGIRLVLNNLCFWVTLCLTFIWVKKLHFSILMLLLFG